MRGLRAVSLTVVLAMALLASGCSSEPPPLVYEAAPSASASGSPAAGPSVYPVPSPRSPRPPKAPPGSVVAPISPVPVSPLPTTASPSPSAVIDAPGGIACGATDTETIGGVVVVTNTTCFDVSGKTMAQLQTSIEANGPKVDDYRRAGATRWKLGWSFDLDDSGRCSVVAPKVKVTATYLLPRWTNPKDASAAVRRQWNRFAAEVKTHEEGHRDIAADAGVAALAVLNSSPSKSDCEQTRRIADARVRAVMDRFRAKQQAYDDAAQGE